MKIRILFIKKAFQRSVSILINLVARQTNFDIGNTMLIIGSTRSGTTFLMESINQNNDYRLIFEPFNNTYTKEWQKFDTREYVDPIQANEHKKSAIHNILSGRISNPWVNRYNRKLRSDKRLVKAVRANFLIDYIRAEYPNLQVVYLVRNPYDVVASRINMNFDARDIYQVLKQSTFLSKHYSDINIDELKSNLDSVEAKHVALWCFENRHLLQLQSQLNLQILRYEDINGNSISNINGEMILTKKSSKPSASSSPRNAYLLNESERKNISNVLKLFGMDEYAT
jgi:hypothetical protein